MQGEHAIMSQEKSLIIHGQDFHLQQIGIQESFDSFHIKLILKLFISLDNDAICYTLHFQKHFFFLIMQPRVIARALSL